MTDAPIGTWVMFLNPWLEMTVVIVNEQIYFACLTHTKNLHQQHMLVRVTLVIDMLVGTEDFPSPTIQCELPTARSVRHYRSVAILCGASCTALPGVDSHRALF